MKNYEKNTGDYLNDFHKKTSEAAQQAVASFKKQPYSLKEAIAQAERLTHRSNKQMKWR